ncbi:hypothetical protein CHUAL_004987 [Chamberlinius hualienensis]
MNFKTRSKRILSSWQRVYSRQSVICAMDRFVDAIDTMNDTILIPARLMDIACEDEQFNDIGYDNYYHCYNMLNTIKTELLWGGGGSHNGGEAQLVPSSSNRRRLSITSSISFSDSDADSDSVISESSTSSSTSATSSSSVSMLSPETIIRNLRHHLFGLSDALNRLADSAIALTCKYQEEIGGRG